MKKVSALLTPKQIDDTVQEVYEKACTCKDLLFEQCRNSPGGCCSQFRVAALKMENAIEQISIALCILRDPVERCPDCLTPVRPGYLEWAKAVTEEMGLPKGHCYTCLAMRKDGQ